MAQEMKYNKYLVLIHNRAHIPQKFEEYIEVEAVDEYWARHIATDVFKRRHTDDASLTAMIAMHGGRMWQVLCAGDSVLLD